MGDQEKKTKEARIRRLRERVNREAEAGGSTVGVLAILKAVLDLLEDEL